MTPANITTAPRDGTIVNVWRDGVPPQAMYWDAAAKAWIGRIFAPMGIVHTIWDRQAAQPTHWAPL